LDAGSRKLAFVVSIAGVVSINGPLSGRDSLERFQPAADIAPAQSSSVKLSPVSA